MIKTTVYIVIMTNTTKQVNKAGVNMTKENWIKHIEETRGLTRPSISGDKKLWSEFIASHCYDKGFGNASSCSICKERRKTKRSNDRAKAIHEAYTSCGMTRVHGALGGVYYE